MACLIVENKPRALALLGPTASGKTALSLALAQRFSLEVVSLDSALIYRRMDIGTAKPSLTERQSVPHHLIDIIEPWQRFSVAEYMRSAQAAIEAINQRGNIALVVGGTMMYYKALTEGLSDIPSTEAAMREALDIEFANRGFDQMYAELEQVDPKWAQQIAANDRQRLLRGLAVYRQTGRALSSFQRRHSYAEPKWAMPAYALNVAPRALLHERIATRLSAMLEAGFVEEVSALMTEAEFDPELPSMRAVGYRQCIDYLNQVIDQQQFLEQANAATRQLAKRQITWLRGLETVRTLEEPDTLYELLCRELENL